MADVVETSPVVALSEEQKAFLEECEAKYADRYTKDDKVYMELNNKDLSIPPIMPYWRANQGGRRDRRRDDRRDDRSYNSRDNRDHRQSSDNYDRGYKKSYDDRNDGRSYYGNNHHQDNYHRRDNNRY